jgi:A/G-specific adenine glycosylase
VLARYFAVAGFPGERAVELRLWELAEACTPRAEVDSYTQAIMDLGATVCTRANPACLQCPVNAGCQARATGAQHRYPAPRPRKVRPQREGWLVLARLGRKVLLEKRAPAGIWGGLWALPEFATRDRAAQWCREHLASAARLEPAAPLRHAFSHFDYDMKPLVVRCAGKAARLRDDDRYRWYDVTAPAALGVPKPITTLLRRARTHDPGEHDDRSP